MQMTHKRTAEAVNDYDNTCAICGKPVAGVVHCQRVKRIARDNEELQRGSRICSSHCYRCKHHDERISIARCRYPKVPPKEKASSKRLTVDEAL